MQAAAADLDRLPAPEREKMQSVYYFEMAKLTARAGRWVEAEGWAGRAVEAFSRRHQENPKFEENRAFLTQCHWHRATARERLGRPAEAATDWGAAADLAAVPMDKAFYRAHRGAALARAGDAEGAAADLAAAVRQAEAALGGDKTPGVAFYDAAAVHALASGAVADKGLAERHGAEAVRLIGRAAAVGYMNDPAQVRAFREADEFAPLHAREDFKKLLAVLEKK